jgi:hypothetical protein
MGIKSLWVDFNNFSGFRPDARYTVEHGMGGSSMRDDGRIGYQNPGQAISGGITGFWDAIDKGNLDKAYHFAQDMATEDHPGKNWARLSGMEKANHAWGDIFLSSDERKNMDAWSGNVRPITDVYAKDYRQWGYTPPDNVTSDGLSEEQTMSLINMISLWSSWASQDYPSSNFYYEPAYCWDCWE